MGIATANTERARQGLEEMESITVETAWLTVTGRDNLYVPFADFVRASATKGAVPHANRFVVNTDEMTGSGRHWFTVACEWKKR